MSHKPQVLTSDVQTLTDRILKYALQHGAEEFQVKIQEKNAKYIRYANSEIHKFSQEQSREFRLLCLIGKRKGLAHVVPTTESELYSAIDKAITLAKVNSEDDNQLPLFSNTEKSYKELDTFDPNFTDWTEERMSVKVKDVVQLAHDVDKRITNVSGMLQCLNRDLYLANSNNLFLHNNGTEYWFSIDVLAKEGQSFGRNSQGAINRFATNIQFVDLATQAANYALLELHPVKLPPGDYSAILDYHAILQPSIFINLGLSAFFVTQHRSFLARKVGKQVFSEQFNLDHIPHNTDVVTSRSFDDEAVPTQQLTFIEEGRVKELAHNRWTAKKMGVEPNGCGYESERTSFGVPMATQLVSPTPYQEEDLIASVEKGVFISRLYYTNWANMMAGILTGSTRNGFYKIEEGEITQSLYPMRHSTSIFEMFGPGLQMGKQLHQPPLQMMPGVQTLLLPMVKSPKIHFTTYSN